ncbi:hypothetical protein SAMN02746041_01265 [Desulfacinum hydrothermale DSM 13146]|uniref:DUF444 family protein n=1 Tax=Desulfacinum hydrothermale DSM 13146 TaxID=1121390 RepID=A0A1W1XDY3_9BACT|nr:DUF444 family protein [Desulfacinum hydrothermale]SMC21711.1 hypothetical protein SAMN02746041_01265 [Desulfacinum hydrothermale DSM 13146]
MDRYDDWTLLQMGSLPRNAHIHGLSSVEDLLERDRQREQDGFPRKIRIGRLVKPSRGGKERVILVPTTVEEKFIHDTRPFQEEGGAGGGSGDGQEGEVIGEEPIHGSEGSGQGGAGQGEGAEHEIEASAYDLGRILSEQFQLPNLQSKGTKRTLRRIAYELTDRHQGSGQILDKKATLRRLVATNIGLGRVRQDAEIDPTELLMGPDDKVYRILSLEPSLEAQALVFFVRDYSGSMSGRPTEVVVGQHVLIYSWLVYQYQRRVETRFILHDTEAREVPDFYTYYNSTIAGGTRVASAYRLVNEIVEHDNLARDYNIYVFHGTDGDDWDSDGSQTLPELDKMLTYANRVGVTVAHGHGGNGYRSRVEEYMGRAKLAERFPDRFRLDTIEEGAGEERLVEGIRQLLS